MSETEHHIGKLTKVDGDGDVEKTARRLLNAEERELGEFYDSWVEELKSDYCDDYVIRGNIIYRVETTERDPCEDISEASRNDDETIKFEVKFYNGGCGFTEAIEYALDAMEKEEK